MKIPKTIAIVFIVILVINMILLALRMISDTIFWTILVTVFIIFYAIKKINEKKGKQK